MADSLLSLGELYRLEHDGARAEPLLKKALRIYETSNDPHQAAALTELGLIALQERKFATAKNWLRQSLNIYQHWVGPAHVLVARVKAALAQAFLGEKNYAEAKSFIQDALATERKSMGDQRTSVARTLVIAGRIEEQGHRDAAAAEYYRQAMDIYQRNLGAESPESREAQQLYARLAKSAAK